MNGVEQNGARNQPAQGTEDGKPDPLAEVPEQPDQIARLVRKSAEEFLAPYREPDSGRLRWRKQNTNAPIVSLSDTYLTGVLDLRGADLDFLFRFERCHFEHPPDVREANLLGLVFRRCYLPGLKARNLRSRNDVRVISSIVRVGPHDGEDSDSTSVRGTQLRPRGVPDAAVNLTDAVIEGSLVLSQSRIENNDAGKAVQADRLVTSGALLAYRLQSIGEVRLPGVRTGGNVNFSGANLSNPSGFALNCDGIQVGGSFLAEVDTYGRGRWFFTTNGVVFMPSARVDGDVVLRGAQLCLEQSRPPAVHNWRSSDPYVDPKPALVADRVKVEGNVELSDGLRAQGTLRMVNARIGGTLRLAEAQVEVPRGLDPPYQDRALHMDGSEISGDVDATRLRISGQGRLADVRIGGNVLARGATFTHAGRDVISARRTTIAGNFEFTNCDVAGTLRLQGVEVGGSVEFYDTQLSNPTRRPRTSFSVDLRTAKIGRDLVFGQRRQERGFTASGGVTLDGAVIARRVNFRGATLRASEPGSDTGHGVALDVSDVAADELALSPSEIPQGRVNLRRAHCATLADNDALWQATGKLQLEDFRYDALDEPIPLDDDKKVLDRIHLLREAMDGYRPGPYDQLAATLRAAGNEEHASTVLLYKQRHRYQALSAGFKVLGPGVRLWSWMQRSMVGYGYRPMRALSWLVMLLVIGSLWFGLGQSDCPAGIPELGPRCPVNQDDVGLEWNPVLYTTDLLVPIVDFGNKGRWYMAGVDKWVATVFTAMGWVLATTVAAGVTRMLRRP